MTKNGCRGLSENLDNFHQAVRAVDPDNIQDQPEELFDESREEQVNKEYD